MKIFLDIGFDIYTSLLAKLDLSNAEHQRLKSALVIAGGEQINGGLVVAILCELEKANALLEFAKKNCPEAVLDTEHQRLKSALVIATSINFYSGQLLDREH